MIGGAIVDLDGTIYRGDSPISGAPEAIERCRELGLSLLFCSNNPTKTPGEYVDRLAGMGIDAEEAEILPASTVTRWYLTEHHPDADIYLLGEPTLASYLAAGGLSLVDATASPDVYVASWTRGFNYDDMAHALDVVDHETTFVGTDPDRTIPRPEGEVPGSGAVIGAVARTVGREPDVILGKPSEQAATLALGRLDLPPESCLVVGDRLDTDLALGDRLGMTTVLVESGVADSGDIESSGVTPDYVVDSIAALPDLLRDERLIE